MVVFDVVMVHIYMMLLRGIHLYTEVSTSRDGGVRRCNGTHLHDDAVGYSSIYRGLHAIVTIFGDAVGFIPL